MVKDNSSTSVVISRLFYEKDGQMIVSAIFGLALALIFRRVCKDNCVVYFAPKINDIDGKMFKIEDTCYKYKPYTVKCNKNENIYKTYDINTKPDNEIIDYGLFSRIFSS
jgi:hypothetical protein